ncbi:hypothetical protein QTH90_00170 [Variovorax sp. J2P1-59]|uniref:hypothetical protein n=1 Tax=Variovorax flavidus TaxID=3053501 RepID=UPI002575ACCA|nr:hypothetical protein [Variovorax sp. J2P1-59]MDM0072779.1 hypothetical protein [Variovorax sp. J2P1-59]
MQPVLEIRKLGERSYTYTVRAPRSAGEAPPKACYVDLGLTSFADCLRDAAQALTYFSRVYIRYEGLCVGQQMVMRLESQPDAVVGELLADYARQTDVPPAPKPLPLQAPIARAAVAS